MSPQKKVALVAGAVLLVAIVVIAAVYYRASSENIDVLPDANAASITLACSNGYSAKATYYDKDSNGVMRRLLLVVAKGENIKQLIMKQELSASGAKFETKDKTVSIWEHQGEFTLEENGVSVALCKDASKMTFTIDGSAVTLSNGVSEEEVAPGSVAKTKVTFFGNEAKGDINGDGKDDRVFFVTKESGGSGVFYYIVAMIETDVLPKGTQAILIGDRIAPQTIAIQDGIILVNYADRKLGEPFTASPSVGKTIRLKLDPQVLDFGEVAADFEGEASVTTMNLSMKEWEWQKTLYNNDKEVLPIVKKKFIATFTKDGYVTFKTDCNTATASFVVATGSISFTQMATTRMFCEGSQEQAYVSMLEQVGSYIFTSRGELILLLKNDSGSMVFK